MAPSRYDSIYKSSLLAGKVVLVTGGGTGIGRCIAHELASLSCTVVIAARRLSPLLKTQEEIGAAGYEGRCDVLHPLDIRDHEQCKKAIQDVVRKWGRLDGLVNNAGGQFPSPAEKISPKGWRSVVDLNLTGTFFMAQAAYEGYMKENGGSIVNVIVDMWNGWYWVAHSAAARAGVYNLTRTLAQEWTPHSGVRINCVAPGAIIGAGQSNYPPSVQKKVIESFSYQNPSGRLGTESEVSSAIVFLLTPGASYINGACINVDGGQSIRQGPIFDTVFSPDSKLPIYHGFGSPSPDDDLGMGPGFRELFGRMAAIKPPGDAEKGKSNL
ncbi:NAD(P)-binding protein [Gonapodya prolifera JEL478]|uniref:Peroxisomal trans-2-enoyl-CoA reductase n=1 Tax=Gonapodya prolifera (strain JEL478) TaxID=1344416 RepID=A0A138ZZI3_GONPJ|nr:NAD(P)-binding protein [Gonapodya prolifera JEL478]|eukprot:KXS09543.1 NAD(P)-binding protein [Gonapodya prolifera JEL478]